MRLRHAWVALALLLPLATFPASTASAPHATVDLGDSQVVPVAAAVRLDAQTSGLTAPTAFWTSAPDCTLTPLAGLAVEWSCASAGIHTLALYVEDRDSGGALIATHEDEVAYAFSSESTRSVANVKRFVAADALGTAFAQDVDFEVPAGATGLVATVNWTSTVDDVDDYDLALATAGFSTSSTSTSKPEEITLTQPAAGAWTATVEGATAVASTWHLKIDVTTTGTFELPAVAVAGGFYHIGDSVELTAAATAGAPPLAYAWDLDGDGAFDDATGASVSFAFAGHDVRVRAVDASGLRVSSDVSLLDLGSIGPRSAAVVAVIDNAFSPYHQDFLGAFHPWNQDADASNDLDFDLDPALYLDGYPGATPLALTLPTSGADNVDELRGGDAAVWADMASSSLNDINMYRLPGTKIIGALTFGGTTFQSTNSQHGTRSAASAAGNIHGTCPECLLVMMVGDSNAAITWAAQQPWIDVITNSYGKSIVGGPVRDNVYLNAPVDATRAGSQDGQVIVFSAGNGLVNAFDVPMFTYWSSEKGPDWMVTVGAIDTNNNDTYSGAGKPVDMSSIGTSYPSTGGTTWDGTGTHSGTSNAAPTSAGYFGRLIYHAREALGDTTLGHAAGVIANGTPIACGAAETDCALGDGELTRSELQDLVFHNIQPDATVGANADTTWPTTEYNYYYAGHGIVTGRYHSDAVWEGEYAPMWANAVGQNAAQDRPNGEANWFVIDSKCRQKLWGAWDGGYYTGEEPTLDNAADPIASTFNTWCSQIDGYGALR